MDNKGVKLILPRTSRLLAKRVISKSEVNYEHKKETSPPVVCNNHTAQFNAQVLKRVGANRDGV
jgi:hypothetical protein